MASVKELHEKFYGNQDKYMNLKLDSCPFKSIKIKETKKFTIEAKSDKRIIHNISDNLVINDGITNFKISPSTALIYIDFNVGGQHFERNYLFNELNNEAKIYLLSNKSIFPILKYFNLNIFFETKVDTTIIISYDVLELQQFNNEVYEWHTIQEQFTDAQEFNDYLINRIQLSFNHPIIRLYAFLPHDVEDARVLLNDYDHNLVLTSKDNYYTIEFGDETSINFSRISNIELQIKTKTSHPNFKPRIYGINKNVVRIMAGMAKMAF